MNQKYEKIRAKGNEAQAMIANSRNLQGFEDKLVGKPIAVVSLPSYLFRLLSTLGCPQFQTMRVNEDADLALRGRTQISEGRGFPERVVA